MWPKFGSNGGDGHVTVSGAEFNPELNAGRMKYARIALPVVCLTGSASPNKIAVPLNCSFKSISVRRMTGLVRTGDTEADDRLYMSWGKGGFDSDNAVDLTSNDSVNILESPYLWFIIAGPDGPTDVCDSNTGTINVILEATTNLQVIRGSGGVINTNSVGTSGPGTNVNVVANSVIWPDVNPQWGDNGTGVQVPKNPQFTNTPFNIAPAGGAVNGWNIENFVAGSVDCYLFFYATAVAPVVGDTPFDRLAIPANTWSRDILPVNKQNRTTIWVVCTIDPTAGAFTAPAVNPRGGIYVG